MQEAAEKTLRQKVSELERAEILRALDLTGWVKARAARRLGITERMISYKMSKYGIKKEVKPMAFQPYPARGQAASK